MVKCKDDVRFGGFTTGLVAILHALVIVARNYKDDIMITSGSEGKHLKTSKHYTFQAVDIRSHTFPSKQAKYRFMAEVRAQLGDEYTLLLEDEGKPNEHIHIQVRKGLNIL